PGTFTPDMCAHQYDQQTNQVVCKVSKERVYVNNEPDANIYGLEPNFGCCTANLHQGWPKLAAHLWMASADGGLAALTYGPCSARARVAGKPVHVEVQTDYPFADTVRLTVHADEAVRFPLRLRVPGWAVGAEVAVAGGRPARARAGTFHVLRRRWEGA